MSKVMYILSYLSSSLEFWSVNHMKIQLKVFKNKKVLNKISINWRKDLLGTNLYKILESCWK